MESNDIKELAQSIINGEVENIELVILYPFLKQDDLGELLNQLITQNKSSEIEQMLPFLNKEQLAIIQDKILNHSLEIDETSLYPFLDKEQLKELFHQYIKDHKQ
jgi:hypothetical protein